MNQWAQGREPDLQRIRIAHTSNPVGKSGSGGRWLRYFGGLG